MGNSKLSITSDPESRFLAESIGEFLDAPVLASGKLAGTEFVLEIERLRLSLHSVANGDQKPITLNFNQPRLDNGKSPLLRAMGTKTETVIDMTTGWGGDAVRLARHGLQVLAIENNAIVYVMVKNALEHIQSKELKNRIELRYGNSIAILDDSKATADVVYLDPMYPEKPKSALPKKKLAVLRDLVEDIQDDAALFIQANKSARVRIVVKRPHYAAPIAPGKVGEIRSKLLRFDIYKPNG